MDYIRRITRTKESNIPAFTFMEESQQCLKGLDNPTSNTTEELDTLFQEHKSNLDYDKKLNKKKTRQIIKGQLLTARKESESEALLIAAGLLRNQELSQFAIGQINQGFMMNATSLSKKYSDARTDAAQPEPQVGKNPFKAHKTYVEVPRIICKGSQWTRPFTALPEEKPSTEACAGGTKKNASKKTPETKVPKSSNPKQSGQPKHDFSRTNTKNTSQKTQINTVKRNTLDKTPSTPEPETKTQPEQEPARTKIPTAEKAHPEAPKTRVVTTPDSWVCVDLEDDGIAFGSFGLQTSEDWVEVSLPEDMASDNESKEE